MSIIFAEAAGGSGGSINYSSISAPQKFNPDAGQVTADTADFTLSSNNSVAFVSVNGKVLDDAEYSLSGVTLTVTPVNGFDSIDDEVLVFQNTFVMPSVGVEAYSIKTANYTITNDDPKIIYGDTDGGDFTLTLPADPDDGLMRTITSIGSSANTLTIARNGKTINGQSEDLPIGDNISVTLHYTSQGWIIIN